MIWSADCLQIGYQRRLVGFDLRIKEKKRKFSISVDCQIWPEIKQKNSLLSQCNGFNFFDRIDDDVNSAFQAEDSILAAFDIPKDLAELLSSTFGLVLLPIELVSSDKAWNLMGFDIVDIRTQCSALYSFDWSKSERKSIYQKLSLQLNGYGLVQSESDAIGAASAFDKIVPEHFPFTPCGVWGQY